MAENTPGDECPKGMMRRLCEKLKKYPRLQLLTETNILAGLLLIGAFL